MTEHKVAVRDLMDRTMISLAAVDRLYQDGELVYEVTQLINSFLGALAHPWEMWEEQFQAKAGRDERFEGWPDLPSDDCRDQRLPHPGEMLKKLRNAIAHGNVRFVPDDEGQIAKVRLWNETPDGYRDWGTTLNVCDLRKLLERFVAVARELPVKVHPDPPHVKDRPSQSPCPTCRQYPRARRNKAVS